MPTLPELTITALLEPYIEAPAAILPQLSAYLDLLLKWNARTNLTAIREPEEIVRRHFGESLFAGRHLGSDVQTLLDFGSGAGFPGLPIALLRPGVSVTLAESQNKKVAFLREAVRTLGLPITVWPHRVEAMPKERHFDTVALRAVDNMAAALTAAAPRTAKQLLLLTGSKPLLPAGFEAEFEVRMPNSASTVLVSARRVPMSSQ